MHGSKNIKFCTVSAQGVRYMHNMSKNRIQQYSTWVQALSVLMHKGLFNRTFVPDKLMSKSW